MPRVKMGEEPRDCHTAIHRLMDQGNRPWSSERTTYIVLCVCPATSIIKSSAPKNVRSQPVKSRP
jgi:hypothetical protein